MERKRRKFDVCVSLGSCGLKPEKINSVFKLYIRTPCCLMLICLDTNLQPLLTFVLFTSII
jgi:hypothetical protein